MMTNNKDIDNKDYNKDYNKERNNLFIDINNNIQKEKGIYEKENVDLFSIEEKEKCLIAEPKEKEIPYKAIIDYLNEKIGTNYQHTSRKTRDLIKARWNDGFRLNDFYTVIDKKVIEWYNDNKMKMYLRPETLFSNKFESYLNQLDKTITTKDLAPFINVENWLKGGDL